MCVHLFSHPSLKHFTASSVHSHHRETQVTEDSIVSKTVQERGCLLFYFFPTLPFLMGREIMWGVCPLGYTVPFFDLLFAACWQVMSHVQVLGRTSQARESACMSVLFLLSSRCAKSLSSLVKWLLAKCQNLMYSIASVIQSICMSAEAVVLKGRHPI